MAIDKRYKTNKLVFLHSCLQIIGWSLILTYLALYVYNNYNLKYLNYVLHLVKVFQILQVLDFIFSILGCTKTSYFYSLIQILGRLGIVIFFLDQSSNKYLIVICLSCWSLADIIRNMYYICKDSVVLTIFRYNSFIVLYPIGVLSEIMLIENSLNKYHKFIVLLRILQATIFICFLFLYTYLFKQRKKYRYSMLKRRND